MLRKFILIVLMLPMVLLAEEKELIPNPCKLLEKAELEKIVQIPLKPGRLRDNRSTFDGMSCFYFSAKPQEKHGSVTISIDTTASMKATDSIWESAKNRYDKEKYAYQQALKRENKSDSYHPVKGLGEDAYWDHTSLNILDGNTYINIRASGGPQIIAHGSRELDKMVNERELQLSQSIAKRVLQKLKQQAQSSSKNAFFQPTLRQSQTQAPISWVECSFVALAEKRF